MGIWGTGPVAGAENLSNGSIASVAERARGAWENGAIPLALDILDDELQVVPQDATLNKLLGDILSTSRRPQEAVEAYEKVLALQPDALNTRWSKWSVLIRSGQEEESIAELQRIAQFDSRNPLIQLRLAQDLRRFDRLEESVEPYQKAVALVPAMLTWRLGLARARYDILDYQRATSDVEYVLQHVSPGSPLEIPAKNLLEEIYGNSRERGRRFERVFTPSDVTEAQLKEWGLLRGQAWKLFTTERYAEAEPIYRELLALNPKDSIAVYHLGIVLMKQDRCEEAVEVFRKMASLDTEDQDYADTVFRMGQCLVQLERWEDAYVHFKILYDAAVEFEESNKGIAFPPGTRVLDKEKLGRWLDKVRPHVPELVNVPDQQPHHEASVSEEEIRIRLAAMRLTQKALDTRASLMGRDADFSWFRFIIPASKVMRDDFPTGAHEFIPLNANDSFPREQRDIYLVFGLLSASYDAVSLATQCYLEISETTKEQRPIAWDRVTMSMSDQSGYFKLSAPESGWTLGQYRCGLFVGEQTTADTQVDEVRFQIIPPLRSL